MRIKNEDEILNGEVRKTIIEEINGPENYARKVEAFKRYEMFKDKTKKYVLDELLKQFTEKTVNEMSYCISNVSLVRKVIDKLAKVYSGDVIREVKQDDQETQAIQDLASVLNINSAMKKANRFLKLQKNCLVFIKPCPVYIGDSLRYTLKPEVLTPYLFDIVEDYYDREKPLVLVLSNFKTKDHIGYAVDPSVRGVNGRPKEVISDGKDQMIADNPVDASGEEYVFWSSKYHFTCNINGEIISKEEISNPINRFPAVSFNLDQDGQYWARGGEDLIDAGVLVNSIITHMNHIGVVQGYGQFYMKGKNIPTNVAVGPNKVIRLEYEDGDPVPEIGFAQASPALAELMKSIEMYVALTLTTNNLSTSGVSMQLSSGGNYASGVAMIIDKSESMEDVKDQEQIFLDKEPELWGIISAWLDLFGSKKLLVPELQEIKPPQKTNEMTIKFVPSGGVITEKERLENIKLRKELGINTMIDLIMLDNSGMTREDAESKLVQITDEKLRKIQSSLVSNYSNTGGDHGEETKTKTEEVVQ